MGTNMPAGGPGFQHGPERRTYQLTGLEFRDSGDTGDGSMTLAGHAAVFDKLSLPLYDFMFGEFQERISPGAFTDVLGGDPDVHLVYQHDLASAMARTRSKTLELREDPAGLRVWARLDPSDVDVQRIAPKMRRGDVDQMSFAFTVADDEWVIENPGSADERVVRTIRRVAELFDVSVVPQGAYPQTDANLRALVQSAIDSGRLPTPDNQRRHGPGPLGAETVAPAAVTADLAGGLRIARLKARARVTVANSQARS